MNRTLQAALGFLVLAASGAFADGQPVYAPVKAMNPDEFNATVGKAKHVDFELAYPDGLVDGQGLHIPAASEKDYLLLRKPDKGLAVYLIITSKSPPLDRMESTVGPLGDYGFTTIVVRHKDGGEPMPVSSEFNIGTDIPPEQAQPRFIAIRPNGKSIKAGDPFPDLSLRPADLRPGILPARVRYAFASDEAVKAASVLVADHLLAKTPATSEFLGAQVWVQEGAWRQMKDEYGADDRPRPRWMAATLHPGQLSRFEGAQFSGAAQRARLESLLRAEIARSGGGRIRAMTTDEMARWWPFVGFDYVEPLLVLETTDHSHVFALLFEGGTLAVVDDLKGLPKI